MNNKGFSLVETMMSMGLMGGIVFAVTSNQMSASRVESSFKAAIEMETITGEIAAILSNPDSCSRTFSGILGPDVANYKSVGAGTINQMQILFPDGSVKDRFPTGQQLPGTQTRIASYELNDNGSDIEDFNTTQLIINFTRSRQNQNSGGAGNIQKEITLQVRFNSRGNEVICRTLTDAYGTVWERSGATGNEVTYSGGPDHLGFVGIRTSNPKNYLHVKGGAIFGENNEPCNANNVRAIRYNSARETLEYCPSQMGNPNQVNPVSTWRQLIHRGHDKFGSPDGTPGYLLRRVYYDPTPHSSQGPDLENVIGKMGLTIRQVGGPNDNVMWLYQYNNRPVN